MAAVIQARSPLEAQPLAPTVERAPVRPAPIRRWPLIASVAFAVALSLALWAGIAWVVSLIM